MTYHPGFQQIALVDTDRCEVNEERILSHKAILFRKSFSIRKKLRAPMEFVEMRSSTSIPKLHAMSRMRFGYIYSADDKVSVVSVSSFLVGLIMRQIQATQKLRVDRHDHTFYANGKQVAYHAGPMHGELSSHCELRDIVGGRLLASRAGDLENHNRPTRTTELTH